MHSDKHMHAAPAQKVEVLGCTGTEALDELMRHLLPPSPSPIPPAWTAEQRAQFSRSCAPLDCPTHQRAALSQARSHDAPALHAVLKAARAMRDGIPHLHLHSPEVVEYLIAFNNWRQ